MCLLLICRHYVSSFRRFLSSSLISDYDLSRHLLYDFLWAWRLGDVDRHARSFQRS